MFIEIIQKTSGSQESGPLWISNSCCHRLALSANNLCISHKHTHDGAIYISKVLALPKCLTACCTAGDSGTETERAKTLHTGSKRETQQTRGPQRFTACTETPSDNWDKHRQRLDMHFCFDCTFLKHPLYSHVKLILCHSPLVCLTLENHTEMNVSAKQYVIRL